MWIMAVLGSQDLYKQYMQLEPDQMAYYISIIHFPWTVKIVYGMISDNIPLFGHFRKSYIIVMGLLQFASFVLIYVKRAYENPLFFTVVVMVANFSEAFVNVVTDALLCIEARKDPENGSKDLISLTKYASAIGGIIGGVIGGYITQYSHPKYIFLIYACMGLLVSFYGSRIEEGSEGGAYAPGDGPMPRQETSSSQDLEEESFVQDQEEADALRPSEEIQRVPTGISMDENPYDAK
jgi:MFS family permease